MEINVSRKERIIVTVNNLDVHVVETDEGVVVDVFGKDQEEGEPITSTFAYFQEGEPVKEEKKKFLFYQIIKHEYEVEARSLEEAYHILENNPSVYEEDSYIDHNPNEDEFVYTGTVD